MVCHRKNGLGKNGPVGLILDEKMVQPDHSWLTKNCLAGSINWQLKVVRPDQKWSGVTNLALMSPRCVLRSFQVSRSLALALHE